MKCAVCVLRKTHWQLNERQVHVDADQQGLRRGHAALHGARDAQQHAREGDVRAVHVSTAGRHLSLREDGSGGRGQLQHRHTRAIGQRSGVINNHKQCGRRKSQASGHTGCGCSGSGAQRASRVGLRSAVTHTEQSDLVHCVGSHQIRMHACTVAQLQPARDERVRPRGLQSHRVHQAPSGHDAAAHRSDADRSSHLARVR